MHFEVQTRIEATPAKVWSVLTDAEKLVAGNFGILRIQGSIGPHKAIRLWSEASPKRAFPLKITAFEPGRMMVWEGGMPLGLFKGTRKFLLAADGKGCHFSMREDYTGALAGLIGKSIPDLNPSFRKFAAALKSNCEG